MTGLALDLFEGFGMWNLGGIGVALDALQESVHRPLKHGLIHKERKMASAGSRFAQLRIAVAGEAVFGRGKALGGNPRRNPHQKHERGTKQDAPRAPRPLTTCSASSLRVEPRRPFGMNPHFSAWHLVQLAASFTPNACFPSWHAPQNFPSFMAAIVSGPDLPFFI